VTLSLTGQLATVTLNRPEKLNAIDPGMLARIDAIVGQLDRDPAIRVVLVAGAGGRAFSVGADVNAWAALQPLDMWRAWTREGHRVFERLARLRQPTIAVIDGFAFGGGLELALACDLRIAGATAEFAQPEVKIGTLPGWAGTRRLPEAVGVARAKQMVFGGGRIDAATAARWGLVNETVDGDVMERAAALAEEIAANAPISVQLAKAAIDGQRDAVEAIAGALAASSADGREGIAAFREKRPARFEGR
ncbi:MAG TPA: enoyl-CoA hydratase/isomerase family protein, partial [Thermomicrobiales bacterium]|nr:enoyl-CoA hydratase/isomerase family protein [Thermomicrobiales bacterium]